ncbi:DISARM system phospholipase D-like protein DrmC [Aneurinibacillus sp. Ricciae_BoGa-3]|uniref:DISARM system phospholipase D-like protein DrmC n=1 Tax=Aneurinibacillus sp. Ricciae_BoGa-3 TaxID=3022697 RepID=UPI0023417F60|nr:DISARM system phospholipase D-like protein DrmC [Aneurinibacillus sp. Ricciae_BoGa-3]WCK55156.1 DISARM system phospholipase D-like protein DrmC [Aneurinibacillus sp. Ricciae_BoGa-3]
MNDLWNIISQMGLELHPDRIEYMAKKVAKISSASELLNSSFRRGLNVNPQMLIQLKNAWEKEQGITPREISAALKSASVTASNSVARQGLVELVWTGPDTGLVPVRHTEQVLKEVIDMAVNRVFIVSFVAYELPSIISSLQKAINRNVKIDILLETSNEQGGRVNNDSIKIMRDVVPCANIYVWDQIKNRTLGAVHPKCAVSDGYQAFITSANLTRAAMERNMELGVFIKGGKVPERLAMHLDALIRTGIIIECTS